MYICVCAWRVVLINILMLQLDPLKQKFLAPPLLRRDRNSEVPNSIHHIINSWNFRIVLLRESEIIWSNLETPLFFYKKIKWQSILTLCFKRIKAKIFSIFDIKINYNFVSYHSVRHHHIIQNPTYAYYKNLTLFLFLFAEIRLAKLKLCGHFSLFGKKFLVTLFKFCENICRWKKYVKIRIMIF